MTLKEQFPSSEPEAAATGNADSEATVVTVVTNEGLKILDEQLKDLGKRINAGEYVVEAKQTGKVQDIETGLFQVSRYIDNTTLTVTIKPADTNPKAPIKEMTFTFKNDIQGESGCFSSYEEGTVNTSFRIKMADGDVFYFGVN